MKAAASILPPDVPRYLTIKATAARLGYSAQTVAMLVQEGRLPAVNIVTRPGETHACYIAFRRMPPLLRHTPAPRAEPFMPAAIIVQADKPRVLTPKQVATALDRSLVHVKGWISQMLGESAISSERLPLVLNRGLLSGCRATGPAPSARPSAAGEGAAT